MINHLTQDIVITAIKAIISNGHLGNSKDAVWWKKKLIDPDLIADTIAIQESIVNDANTQDIINKLLEIGFPIVDTTVKDNFFSKRELETFQTLIARKDYDSNNPVDINIGQFLRETVWQKTKIWAEKLEQKGWTVVSKRRGWNTRHQKKGFQTYKQYAWGSLKPEIGGNNLLLFTVGVHTDGNLAYKLDIQWNDSSFSQEQKDLFFNLRAENDASFQFINKATVNSESWNSLIDKSDEFFTNHLSTYNEIYYKLWSEKRLMRLVWNSNEWQIPSNKPYNPSWQGRSDKAHHEQYGFGFEEWLFNDRYLIQGEQYGYIRGVDTMPDASTFINELFIYTINPNTKEQFIIGKLTDVTLYQSDDEIEDNVLEVFEEHRDTMIEELATVGADTSLLQTIELKPNLSFNIDNAEIYEEPILVPENLLKINRFIPRKIENEIKDFLEGIEIASKEPKFNFSAGNGTGSNAYSQNVTGGKRQVNRTHANITNDLHSYLVQSSEYEGCEISTEKTRIGNNLVDCAVLKNDTITIFEAKTTNSVLSNIRQALGQIIEYALLDENLTVEKLIIVGPAKPTARDIDYIDALKECLSLPLFYWSYSADKKDLSQKFKQH